MSDLTVALDAQTIARFWSKVDRSDLNGCWPWLASTRYGYGQIRVKPKRTLQTHRLAFVLVNGPVAAGLVLDHLCRNRACCNPAHMEPVTNAENIVRGLWGDSSRRNQAKTHCPQGHEYTPDNVYTPPNRKARHCRECNRIQHRRRSKTASRG